MCTCSLSWSSRRSCSRRARLTSLMWRCARICSRCTSVKPSWSCREQCLLSLKTYTSGSRHLCGIRGV